MNSGAALKEQKQEPKYSFQGMQIRQLGLLLITLASCQLVALEKFIEGRTCEDFNRNISTYLADISEAVGKACITCCPGANILHLLVDPITQVIANLDNETSDEMSKLQRIRYLIQLFVGNDACLLDLLEKTKIDQWGSVKQFVQCVADMENGGGTPTPAPSGQCDTFGSVITEAQNGQKPLLQALGSICAKRQRCSYEEETAVVMIVAAINEALRNGGTTEAKVSLVASALKVVHSILNVLSADFKDRFMKTQIGSWGTMDELLICAEKIASQTTTATTAMTTSVGVSTTTTPAITTPTTTTSTTTTSTATTATTATTTTTTTTTTTAAPTTVTATLPPTDSPVNCKDLKNFVVPKPDGKIPVLQALQSACTSRCNDTQRSYLANFVARLGNEVFKKPESAELKVLHVNALLWQFLSIYADLKFEDIIVPANIDGWGPVGRLMTCIEDRMANKTVQLQLINRIPITVSPGLHGYSPIQDAIITACVAGQCTNSQVTEIQKFATDFSAFCFDPPTSSSYRARLVKAKILYFFGTNPDFESIILPKKIESFGTVLNFMQCVIANFYFDGFNVPSTIAHVY
ncbi:hypothetical protein Tcan_12118 [Toxocara canis]|uniref:Uncharacterized protein n=1 Tax=Toxocara canis TaxID=6265 RepID=A0A0B2USY3_TOXCA|nr:hypothetical protein Tcan_12118 [Toxocara canis]